MARRYLHGLLLMAAVGSIVVGTTWTRESGAAPRRRAVGSTRTLPPVRADGSNSGPVALMNASSTFRTLPTVQEARRIVEAQNDVYQVTLTEIHRRFPAGNGQPIVAAVVIRDVQRRVSGRGPATSRFLAVDTPAMNRDHLPRDAFEQKAVDELRRGAQRYEVVEPSSTPAKPGSRLRVAIPVPLGGSCFPCHATPMGGTGRAAIAWSVALAEPAPPPSATEN
ncbi:MAG: DUF3365 domain-containing protein [Armatimonadetes bacterium]|nr:DUF3365 domain-containing protein [Armatimonadota bacterium]